MLAQGEDPVHPDRGNTWAGAFIQRCRPCHVTQVGTAAAHARVEHPVAAAQGAVWADGITQSLPLHSLDLQLGELQLKAQVLFSPCSVLDGS